MSSLISGPISSSFDFGSSWNSNSNSVQLPESEISFSNYAYHQMNPDRRRDSLFKLDLLQWQDQPSNWSSSNNLSSSRSQKNHIRENIRNLRRFEQQRRQQLQLQAQQRHDLAASLTDRSLRSIQTPLGHNRQLPPRPSTSCSNQLVNSKSLQNCKGVSTTSKSTTAVCTTEYGDNRLSRSRTIESSRSRKDEKFVQTWTADQYQNQCDDDRHRDHYSDQAVQTQFVTKKPPTPNNRIKTGPRSLNINVSKAIQTGDSEHATQTQPQDFRSIQITGKENRLNERKPGLVLKPIRGKPKPVTLVSGDHRLNKQPEQQQRHHEFLRAHARDAVAESDLKLLSTVPIQPLNCQPDPSKRTVPHASIAKKVPLIRRNINFIRANAHLASTSPARLTSSLRRASSMSSLTRSRPMDGQFEDQTEFQTKANQSVLGMWPERKLPSGVIPPYLIKRQQKSKEIRARSEMNKPDPDQPPGHQRMPEQERLDTLELLKKAHADLLGELVRLPIRSDTLRVRSRRAEIETRLAELEQAIGIFSKPKVFIKPD